MKTFALLIAVTLLTSCAWTSSATKERVVSKVVEVKVPVSTPCIKARPAVPDYRFGMTPYSSLEESVVVMASDLELAKQYGSNWEAAAAGCVISPSK